MRLAELREEEQSEDSLNIYIAQVDPLINQKNKESYREAVGLLSKDTRSHEADRPRGGVRATPRDRAGDPQAEAQPNEAARIREAAMMNQVRSMGRIP